jgi:hypothetical membrane protein
MSTLTDTRDAAASRAACTPRDRVTKSLLGYGVIAGPVYVVASVVQAFVRDGFDPTRHAWSLLAAGPYGWVQSLNLVLTGAMVIAFAVGLSRSAPSRWAPRLVAVFGLGMVAAGFLVADPMDGFPVGMPTPSHPTWHGIGHLVSASLGFWAMVVAALILARMYARLGRRGFAWWSRLTGIFFVTSIVGLASGSAQPAVVVGFTASVVAVFTLLAGVAVDRYRSVGAHA